MTLTQGRPHGGQLRSGELLEPALGWDGEAGVVDARPSGEVPHPPAPVPVKGAGQEAPLALDRENAGSPAAAVAAPAKERLVSSTEQRGGRSDSSAARSSSRPKGGLATTMSAGGSPLRRSAKTTCKLGASRLLLPKRRLETSVALQGDDRRHLGRDGAGDGAKGLHPRPTRRRMGVGPRRRPWSPAARHRPAGAGRGGPCRGRCDGARAGPPARRAGTAASWRSFAGHPAFAWRPASAQTKVAGEHLLNRVAGAAGRDGSRTVRRSLGGARARRVSSRCATPGNATVGVLARRMAASGVRSRGGSGRAIMPGWRLHSKQISP